MPPCGRLAHLTKHCRQFLPIALELGKLAFSFRLLNYIEGTIRLPCPDCQRPHNQQPVSVAFNRYRDVPMAEFRPERLVAFAILAKHQPGTLAEICKRTLGTDRCRQIFELLSDQMTQANARTLRLGGIKDQQCFGDSLLYRREMVHAFAAPGVNGGKDCIPVGNRILRSGFGGLRCHGPAFSIKPIAKFLCDKFGRTKYPETIARDYGRLASGYDRTSTPAFRPVQVAHHCIRAMPTALVADDP